MSIWAGIKNKIFDLLSGLVKEAGGQTSLPVSDSETRCTLNKILKELQIMNIHLQSITDEQILKEDIE